MTEIETLFYEWMWTTVWCWHCRYHLCFFVITSCFQAAFFVIQIFFATCLPFSVLSKDDFLWITNIHHKKQREHVYLINAKCISLLSLIMTVECINEFKFKSTEFIFLPNNGENCITKENGVLIRFWYRSR